MRSVKEMEVGDGACYIEDFGPAECVCEIPASTALSWVRMNCLESSLGNGKVATAEMGFYYDRPCVMGWLNKYFIIIEVNSVNKVAISLHDDIFYLYKFKIAD